MNKMIKVRFQSSCPVCKNPNFFYWVHGDDRCYRKGNLFLDNKAMLSCDSCPAKDYIFRWKFNCGQINNGFHKCGFESGNLQGFLACLSNLGKLENPPGNFIIEVTQILMAHQNEFKESY